MLTIVRSIHPFLSVSLRASWFDHQTVSVAPHAPSLRLLGPLYIVSLSLMTWKIDTIHDVISWNIGNGLIPFETALSFLQVNVLVWWAAPHRNHLLNVQTYCHYKARHAHKRLYTVLPKYSKIQVLPSITSCRLMKYNKQAIELNSLLNK